MTPTPGPGAAADTAWLASLAGILRRDLRSLRKEVEAYPDDDLLWTTPPGLTNSGGNLVLHLCGNLQFFLGDRLGATGYIRNREAEFGARGFPRRELLAEIAATETAVDAALSRVSPAAAGEYPDALGGFRVSLADALVHLAVHLGYHLGQLDYHRRVVAGDPSPVGAMAIGELASARRP